MADNVIIMEEKIASGNYGIVRSTLELTENL